MIPNEISIDTTPQMRGWDPFMEWLRDHDLDPMSVRSVAMFEDGTSARVVVYVRDATGRFQLGGIGKHKFVMKKAVTIKLRGPFPYRTPRGEVLRTWPLD